MQVTEPYSISHGTMRPEDLIPTFETHLEAIGRRDLLDNLRADIMPPGPEDEYKAWLDSEDADYYLEGLFDALNECAGEGLYFGAHPGDGSDYGFWPVEDM